MAKCRKLLKNRYTGNNYTIVSILCMFDMVHTKKFLFCKQLSSEYSETFRGST